MSMLKHIMAMVKGLMTIAIICFNIDTSLSNNKGTNIVIVGVVLLHVKKNPVINENLH